VGVRCSCDLSLHPPTALDLHLLTVFYPKTLPPQSSPRGFIQSVVKIYENEEIACKLHAFQQSIDMSLRTLHEELTVYVARIV